MQGSTNFNLTNPMKDGKKYYYGKYRGIVTQIQDPNFQGRIKAQVPSVLGNYECAWALPCVPFAGDNCGMLFLPGIGDGVWIEFEEGNPDKPIWTGFWWKSEAAPFANTANYGNQKRTLVLPGGQQIEFDNNGGVVIKANSVNIGDGTNGVARKGDAVQITVNGTTSIENGTTNHSHTFNVTVTGSITGGSSKVKSG